MLDMPHVTAQETKLNEYHGLKLNMCGGKKKKHLFHLSAEERKTRRNAVTEK